MSAPDEGATFTSPTPRSAARFLVVTLPLATWFVLASSTTPLRRFDAGSEALVRASVETAVRSGIHFNGGFMTRGPSKGGSPYTSTFALQYQVLALVAPRTGSLDTFFAVARAAVGALFAVVLGLFISDAWARYGRAAALTMLALCAASRFLVSFSSNLYWWAFLSFLPFVLAWVFYDRFAAAHRRGVLVAMVGALVLVKSLCGYEYISNVILAPAVAVFCRELESGAHRLEAGRRSVPFVLAGVLGFAVAAAAHIAQGALWTGSLIDGVHLFLGPALYRTSGDILGEPVSLGADLRTWTAYFAVPDVLLVPEFGLLAVTAVALFLLQRADTARSRSRTILPMLVLAALASATWNVLARGHMRYHLHLNAITFYLPFNLFAFEVMGRAVSALRARRVVANGVATPSSTP